MAHLVPIASRLTIPEALVIRSLLEAHGISASLDAVHHATMAWHHTMALQGLTVSVPQPDAEHAKSLLAIQDREIRPDPTDDSPTGATGVTQVLVSVGIWALTGLPCPYWQRTIKPEASTDPDEH